jgi:hypothetical protein
MRDSFVKVYKVTAKGIFRGRTYEVVVAARSHKDACKWVDDWASTESLLQGIMDDMPIIKAEELGRTDQKDGWFVSVKRTG